VPFNEQGYLFGAVVHHPVAVAWRWPFGRADGRWALPRRPRGRV